MDQFEKFIGEVKTNKYEEAQSRIPEVRKEYQHVQSCINVNINSREFKTINTLITLLDDGKLQDMIKYKKDALEEFDMLKTQYEKHCKQQTSHQTKSHESTDHSHRTDRSSTQRRATQSNDTPTYQQTSHQTRSYMSTDHSHRTDRASSQRRAIQSNDTPTHQGKNMSEVIREKDIEIDNLRNRLSKAAGQKLYDGNSSIADLSDPRRPTKLAEFFSELYDNEFTDAIEEKMKKERDEEKAIKFLTGILRKANDFTVTRSHMQLTSIMTSLSCQQTDQINIQSKQQADLMRQARIIQKDQAHFAVDSIIKEFLRDKEELSRTNHIKAYAIRCVELTWYFNVQLPKLHLQWEREESKIRDHLNFYTKSGTFILYQVWPTLCIEEGGAVLRKGIVQGK